MPHAVRVNEHKRIQAQIAFGGKARRRLGRLYPGKERRGFRVRSEECAYFRHVRLARHRIGLLRFQQIVESLRRGDRKHRHAVHARSPLLSVRQRKSQRHAANRRAAVRPVRVADRDRKAAHHGRATGREYLCVRVGLPLAITLEIARHAHALGMVAAIAREHACIGLQLIHQSRRRQPLRCQPATDIAEGDDGD